MLSLARLVPLATLAMIAALTGQGFSPIAERDGVKVYRKDSGRGIELGAEGNIAAPPAQVRAVLLDYANHTKWVHNLAESRVLDRGPNSLDVYQRLALPVIEDRDFTLHVTWGEDAGGGWIRFTTANDRGPKPVRGAVRVPLNEGSWRLEPIDGGKATHAIYQFHMDLGGSLPGWMGKSRAGKDIPHLFDAIRHQTQYYR
jgi:hypothetical protein